MSASDMFAMGKAAMVMTHTVDANRFKDPKKAPNIQNDWGVLLRPNGMHPSQTSITRPIMTSTVT